MIARLIKNPKLEWHTNLAISESRNTKNYTSAQNQIEKLAERIWTIDVSVDPWQIPDYECQD